MNSQTAFNKGKLSDWLSPKKKLGTRLLLFFLLISVVPLAVIVNIGTYTSNKSFHETAIAHLSYTFNQTSEDIKTYFIGLHEFVHFQTQAGLYDALTQELNAAMEKKNISTQTFVKSADWVRITSKYDELCKNIVQRGGFYDIFLIKNNGDVIYTLKEEEDLGSNLLTGKLMDSNLGVLFRETQTAPETNISDITKYGPSGENLGFFIIAPMKTIDGASPGYVAFQVTCDSLYNILKRTNQLGETSCQSIVGIDGKVRISSLEDKIGTSFGIQIKRKSIENWAKEVETNPLGLARFENNPPEVYDIENEGSLVGSLKPISELEKEGVHLAVLQEIGVTDAYGSSEKVILIMVPLVLVIMLIVTIYSFIMSRRIVRPIVTLSNWAQEVAKGDLTLKPLNDRLDEIGVMNDSFIEVVNSFGEISKVSESMAVGDFDSQVTVRSEKDLLAISINEMLKTFRSVVEQARRISNGDYTGEIQPRSEKDELGKALQQMTRTLRVNSADLKDQDWLKTGKAELNILMTGDKSISDLTREVIKFLTKYLDSQLGLFYLKENIDDLTLIASYAFMNRTGNFNRLKIGEGLVGQAALEQEIIHFNDLKENAPALNFGVDEKIPAHFIIAPLVFKKQLVGVIQIGSVNPFTPLQNKFLEQILEPLAMGLNTAQSSTKVKLLLEQTQEQAERLQAQQEELRQTNEELEEQTKALKVSEETLQAQQEELKVINEELEERTKALEIQRDDIRRKNTDLEKAQKEIEAKAKDLERASKYKSEFLANMSHELRTPLNSIIVLSQLMSENKKGNLSDKQVEFAKTIHTSGIDLLELINEILDLSKIEAGKIELYPEKVSMKDFLSQVKMMFQPLAEKKGIKVEIEFGQGTPEMIIADSQRLQQIVRNLVSNAVKFTEKGSVTVRMSTPPENMKFATKGLTHENAFVISVIDTGIGIPEDKLDVIFEAFHQADGTTSRKYGGTGLGLTISRSFATLMGGEIQIASQMGKGSEFSLVLPVVYEKPYQEEKREEKSAPAKKLVEEKEEKPIPQKQISNQQVSDDRDLIIKGDKVLLIIEDDQTFAGILSHLANEKGFRSIIAISGEEGLELCREYLPSAIILDIGLPGIDGWEVLEQLKKDPITRHIPVHFISGSDSSAEAFKKGAIGFLTKPVELPKVQEAFLRIEEMITKPVKKLLIVENDKSMQTGIMELIGDGDVKSTAVAKGEDAYLLLQNEQFDCMILDLSLDDMSGFELIEKIKKNPLIGYIPIIIYTGKELTKAEDEKLKNYADSVIIKGIRSPERLLAETTLFLHRVESNLPKDKQVMLKMLYHKDDVLVDKTVLVVDDDERNVFALTSILEEKGLRVLTSTNGQDSLRKLKSNKDINLVLMDVMMPEMDGFEAISQIRKMPNYRDLPIIALTAKAMKEDRERCLEVGANDYLSKPVDSQKLLSLIRIWLSK